MTREELLKVERVEAFLTPTYPNIPVMVCHLEDGRTFELYHVPYEIVRAVNKIMEEGELIPSAKERETVFDILPLFKSVLEELNERIVRVVIDYLDQETALYTATLEIKTPEGIVMKVPMVPSHAIYLALLTRRPIYVLRKLVDEQSGESGLIEP